MSDQPPSDALLVVRCQLGDEAAWRELIERWHGRLWAFIVRVSPDDSQAEDVLQTVWLRVVCSMIQLKEPERWAAWVFGIARAAVADRFRREYRQGVAEMIDDVGHEDTGAEQLAVAELVGAGIARLHPTDREAVVLHYLEELPIAEVAEICGVPAGTIKSRLYRAREVLRREMQRTLP